MNKRTKRTLVVIVILLLLALAALFIWRSLRPGPVAEFVPPVILPDIQSLDDLERYTANKPIPEVSAASSLPALDPYDHLYGDPEADIVAILYTNMRNPYAKLMTDAFKTLAEEDPSIAFVYRHYASENPVEDLQASQLSECVFLELDDSAYWAFLSQVQAKEYDLEGMLVSVTDVGGDADMARTCLETKETWNYVLSQRQQAELVADIDVSPSVILWRRSTNDVRIIPGANPMAYIEETIADMR
jgi:hypothetical protein